MATTLRRLSPDRRAGGGHLIAFVTGSKRRIGVAGT
jgi:hypothetical protein